MTKYQYGKKEHNEKSQIEHMRANYSYDRPVLLPNRKDRRKKGKK